MSANVSGTFDWLTFHTGPESSSPSSVFDPSNTRLAGFEAEGAKAGPVSRQRLGARLRDRRVRRGKPGQLQRHPGPPASSYVADCTKAVSGTPSSCTPPATPVFMPVPAALNFGSRDRGVRRGDQRGVCWHDGRLGRRSAQPPPALGLHGRGGGRFGSDRSDQQRSSVSALPLTLSAQPYIFVFLEDTSVTTPTDNFAWAPDTAAWYLMPGNVQLRGDAGGLHRADRNDHGQVVPGDPYGHAAVCHQQRGLHAPVGAEQRPAGGHLHFRHRYPREPVRSVQQQRHGDEPSAQFGLQHEGRLRLPVVRGDPVVGDYGLRDRPQRGLLLHRHIGPLPPAAALPGPARDDRERGVRSTAGRTWRAWTALRRPRTRSHRRV